MIYRLETATNSTVATAKTVAMSENAGISQTTSTVMTLLMGHPLCASSADWYKSCTDLAGTVSQMLGDSGLDLDALHNNIRNEQYNLGNVQTYAGEEGSILAASPVLAAFEGKKDGLADADNCAVSFGGNICIQHYVKDGVAALSVAIHTTDKTDPAVRRRGFSIGGFIGAVVKGVISGGAGGAAVGSMGSLFCTDLNDNCTFYLTCGIILISSGWRWCWTGGSGG